MSFTISYILQLEQSKQLIVVTMQINASRVAISRSGNKVA